MFKRVLMAASVAAVFAAPAFAEVTVYGSVRTGIEYSSVSGPGAVSRLRLADQSSRLGFKGTDKLDNGMTLSWRSEERIRIGASNIDGTNNASTAGWGNRDQYISLDTNGMGVITAGKQVDAFSHWSNAVIDNALFASEDATPYQYYTPARQNMVLKYESPTVAGFSATVSYDFGKKTATNNANAYYGMLAWSNDIVGVNAAYLKQNNQARIDGNGAAVTDNEAYALAGSVKINDAWSVGAHYELYKSDDQDWKRADYGLGVAYTQGKWGGNAWYLRGDEAKIKGTKQKDAKDQFNLNAHYSLSKATTAGVAYTYFKEGNGSGADVWGGPTSVGAGAGQKSHTFSLNLRTNF